MSTPQEHERLTMRVRELEAYRDELLARNARLTAELAATGRAAQALASYGRTETRG
jgi:tetrahydromethanopterin S-methyltransferase subunit F